MSFRVLFRGILLAAALCAALPASAQPSVLEQARTLLAAGNAKQAFEVLAPLQREMAGKPEFDYLLGVAALDSGRIEESIIAFERVLALIPQHAGAQMDIARAYYAAGSYDLAEAAFLRLRDANPPAPTLAAINRYLDAIKLRRHEASGGWQAYSELGMGYDSNITGVPGDFGAAVERSFGIPGVQPTGNAIKRSAAFVVGGLGAEYQQPYGGGWGWFAGGDVRGRAYRHESDFNIATGEVRAGIGRRIDADQWRLAATYSPFSQKGAAPGDPTPTNDRSVGGVGGEWHHSLDTRTQLGFAVQGSVVRFPDSSVEDFNQVLVSMSWLRSFEAKGSPMLFVMAFASDDRAVNEIAEGIDRSKNLGGLRSYVQYSVNPKLQVFGGAGAIYRRDKDVGARGSPDVRGRDVFGDASVGLSWQFREACALRVAYQYSRNESNIDIYDYGRYEIASTIRCDL
jgi:hypothetical protein